MVAELRGVKLSELKPSPFRNLEMFPLIQGKLDRLQESIAAEGFWEGVIARPAKKGYEIAFGHHRVYAARKVLGDDALVPVIVRDLDDETMLRFMERENAEEHGWDFYHTDVQAVRAAVLAFGEGRVAFPAVSRDTRDDAKRPAPSFRGGRGAELDPTSKVYTAQSLAEFLKRTKDADGKPQRKILTALDVLELLEEGGLKPRAIMGLDHGAVREVVVAAKQAAERARREAEEREAKRLRDIAAKEHTEKLAAERAEREYAAKVKREGEEKARRERDALDAARKKYEAEQRAGRKAALETKRAVERAALDAKIAAAKDTTEKLRTQTVTAIRDERKAKMLTLEPPRRAPVRATDLSPRVARLRDEATRLTANVEAFISMARDPGNAVSIGDLRGLAALLKRLGVQGMELVRLTERRAQ